MNELLEKIKEMNDIKDVQENSTDNSDSYMVGLYNGMEFMIAIAEGRSPLFKSVHKEEQLEMVLPFTDIEEEPIKQDPPKRIYFGD